MPKITLYELDELQLQALIKRAVGEALQEREQPAEDKLLTVKEAAAFFQVSAGTVGNWAAAGLINKKVIGAKVRYSQAELHEAAKTIRKYKPQ